jgi:hypothetical protein
MNKAATYVELRSLTMNPCDLTLEAHAEAQRTWLCAECGRPKKGVGVFEAHLAALPRDPPLNFLNGTLVGVAYKPFLNRFPASAVEHDLYLGPVYGPKGNLLADWVTFHGRVRLIVRGSKHVSHRKCPNCNRDGYFAMGKPYLYPAPPGGAVLYESGRGGLILSMELYETLDLGKWRKLSIQQLNVVDAPRDGLGELVG